MNEEDRTLTRHALHLSPPTVRVDESPHKAQPEPKPRTTLVGAIEAIPNLGHVLRENADAGILANDLHAIDLRLRGYFHVSAGGRVFERVVEQVRQHLPESVAVRKANQVDRH